MRTYRELLNTALSEIGFALYSDFFGSTKLEARQLIALGNRELNELKKDDWNELRTPWVFDLTSSNLYDLPSDFRQFNYDTAWSETRRSDFPVTSEVWAYYQARNITNGLALRIRMSGGRMEIDNPAPGQEVYFEYISNSPVRDNQDNPKPAFESDEDTLILNDDLFIMGVIWRFMKVKGLDWEPNYAEYKNMYKREKAVNSNAQTINTVGGDYDPPYPPSTDLWISP